MRAGVDEVDAKDVVFGRPDDRPGNRAVVRPGGKENARRDLDLLVERPHLVLTHSPRLVRERRGWKQEIVEVVRASDGGRAAADHRGVPHRGVVVHMSLRRALRSLCVAVQRHLGEHRSGNDWGCSGKEAPTRKFRHD